MIGPHQGHANERANAHAQLCAQRVLLFAQSINHIDATGVETFSRLRQQLSSQQRAFWVIGLKLPVERRLEAAQALQPDAHFRRMVCDVDALKALNPG
ncbi:MAG: hypothetical protein KGZ67_00625 [Hydrogenophaga sp.]|nr:hypothetical protein [Hydrogenophaga sp.]